MLYLTGIEEQDIQNILDFIYLGEAVVAKSGIDRFMEVAEKFKISGLIEYKENIHKDSFVQEKEEVEMTSHGNEMTKETNKDASIDQLLNFEEIYDEEEQKDMNVDMKTEDIEKSTARKEKDGITTRFDHYTVDEETRRFKCNDCGNTQKTAQNLKTHVMSKHQGIRFPCNVCDYKGTTKGNTSMHTRNKHSL